MKVYHDTLFGFMSLRDENEGRDVYKVWGGTATGGGQYDSTASSNTQRSDYGNILLEACS